MMTRLQVRKLKKFPILILFCALAAASLYLNKSPHNNTKQQPQPTAGQFDYYLLALSWSPTFCLTRPENAQCSGKGYGFVLHGLWPQYAKGGWPQSCDGQAKLSQAERARGMEVFVTPALLKHEWAKHGTCSGLDAMGYLAAADRALAAVKIPEPLQPLSKDVYYSAQDIAQMFRRSNPGIPGDGLAVICRGPELSEVRVCMGKDLSFQACGKGVKNQCRSGDIRVPPVR